jgi:hypothetical protein
MFWKEVGVPRRTSWTAGIRRRRFLSPDSGSSSSGERLPGRPSPTRHELKGPVRGLYFDAYVMLDIYSRKNITGRYIRRRTVLVLSARPNPGVFCHTCQRFRPPRCALGVSP